MSGSLFIPRAHLPDTVDKMKGIIKGVVEGDCMLKILLPLSVLFMHTTSVLGEWYSNCQLYFVLNRDCLLPPRREFRMNPP